MLVLQPPARDLLVERIVGPDDACQVETTLLPGDRDAGGITMGALYDITEAHQRGNDCSQFCVGVVARNGGLSITLRLRSERRYQCIYQLGYGEDMKSEASEVDVDKLPWVDAIWEEGKVYDIISRDGPLKAMQWGALEPWEWEEWQRLRCPMSLL